MSTNDGGGLKFNSSVVYTSISILNSAIRAFEDADKLLKSMSQYTNFKRVSVAGLDALSSTSAKCTSAIRAESGSLSADCNAFAQMESSNVGLASLSGSLPQVLTAIGDDIYSGISSSGVFGVEINDYSMFTDMSQDEYYQFWYDVTGRFGVDQGSLKYNVIGNEIEVPVYAFEKDNILNESDFDSFNDYVEALNSVFFGFAHYVDYKDEYRYLQDFLTDENGYAFSPEDASRVLSLVDCKGACTYAATVDAIAYEYRDKPERFEKCFGFPLYRELEDGKVVINNQQLLLDLFVYSNIDGNGSSDVKEALFKYDQERETGLTINDDYFNLSSAVFYYKYEDPDDFYDPALYSIYYMDDYNEVRDIHEISDDKNGYLAQLKNTYTYNQNYLMSFSPDSDFGFSQEIIDDYLSSDPNVEVNYEVIYTNFDEVLGEDSKYKTEFHPLTTESAYDLVESLGENLNNDSCMFIALGSSEDAQKGYSFEVQDTKVIHPYNDNSAHVMPITNIVKNNIVSATWGNEAFISLDDLENSGFISISKMDIQFTDEK